MSATEQNWILSIRYPTGSGMARAAVVGPARHSTVEAALHMADLPEVVRAKVRSCDLTRRFVEGALDPKQGGYYFHSPPTDESMVEGRDWWVLCVGSVHAVVS